MTDVRQKKTTKNTIYACSRPTSKLLITLYDVWCGMFNKLSMTLPPWQSRVPLMPQTKRYIHPSRDHTRCASSSHELGPGDVCLSLACSSIAISSAMAFFFVATYTKHRMFMFLDRSFYCIQDLIALQIAKSNFSISPTSNASLTKNISRTSHWAMWYSVSRTGDQSSKCDSSRVVVKCSLRAQSSYNNLCCYCFRKTIQAVSFVYFLGQKFS
jgi:hypothetical protein